MIITLKPAYLLTLDTGWHTLTVFFTDGSVSTPFMILPTGGGYYSTSTDERYTYVPPSNNPRTGDDSNLALWGALAAASLAGAVLTMRKRKRSH